jgi:acetyl esterase/lipase
MANWHNVLLARLHGTKSREIGPETTLEEFRALYAEAASRFGPVPAEAAFERAQLGQVKGEWVRVPDTQSRRLLLYLHGGFYIAGSPQTHHALVARLCTASRAAALIVDYRLGPEFPFPAALRDAVDAYRFLVNKGYPAESIVIAGDGSGGGLAFACVEAIRNANLPAPAACVALSPWADLSLSGWSMLENRGKDTILNWDALFIAARHYLQGANPADIYASPAFGSLRDFPPIMVHAGALELLRDDASRLGELAAAANVPVSVEIYDGMPHLFTADPAIPESKVSLARIGQFIRAKTPETLQPLTFAKSAGAQARSAPG